MTKTIERTTVPFVDLNRQHQALSGELRSAFDRVIDEGSFTLGTEVEAFEREFAAFLGASHAIGVGSGTDALHFALRAVGVRPGDEVITVANTFFATAEAIIMAGARPVLVDIEPDTFLMDLGAVESAITGKTRAIVPVHLYGQCVDMGRVNEIARRHGLKVIEDACQAHGASLDGVVAGTSGDAGCFSFYPSKNLGAAGDGGMVVTNSGEVADRVRLLRCHGEDSNRVHLESGYCSRLHGLQAAVLRAKLPMLTDWNDMRYRAAINYIEAFNDSAVRAPRVPDGSKHVFHLFVIRARERDAIRTRLAELGVQTAVHYPVPLHLEPALSSLGYRRGEFPQAEEAAEEILSLPMYPYLTSAEVDRVSGAVLEAAHG